MHRFFLFPVPHVIVVLSWREATGEEGARVELVVCGQALGVDGPDPRV